MHLSRDAARLCMLFVAAGGMCVGAAESRAVTLGQLVSTNGSLSIGTDLVLDQFTAIPTSYLTPLPDLSQIEVLPLTTPQHGVRFEGSQVNEMFSAASPSRYADLLIGFRVRVVNGPPLQQLELAYSRNVAAGGWCEVVERLTGTGFFNQIQVNPNDGDRASIAIPSLYELTVLKDASAVGGVAASTTLINIEQFFTVPEPSALLLAAGGVLFMQRRRLRQLAGRVNTPACVLCVAICLAGGGTAQAITLEDLMQPGATLTSGPLVFSNFQCQITTENFGLGDESAIDVSPLDSGLYEEGVRFAGLLMALAAADANSSLHATIEYDVTAPRSIISAANMNFNGSVSGPGSRASVVKTLTSDGVNLGSIEVSTDNTPQSLFDSMSFSSSFLTLHVVDQVELVSGLSGSASISNIEQTYITPEPAALLLLALGGLAVRRRG